MKLRTTLAAAPAVALLALATCADPSVPTAADPAGLGAETPPGPASPVSQAYVAEWPDCKIVSSQPGTPETLIGRRGRALGPPPRPVPFEGTVNVVEGLDYVTDVPQMLFYPEPPYCPTWQFHGVDLSIRLDSIGMSTWEWWFSPGSTGGRNVTPPFPPYLLWPSDTAHNRWFLTFNGPTNRLFTQTDSLWLSLVDDSTGTVYDVALFESTEAAEDPHDPQDDILATKCWLYFGGEGLSDSEACEVP